MAAVSGDVDAAPARDASESDVRVDVVSDGVPRGPSSDGSDSNVAPLMPPHHRGHGHGHGHGHAAVAAAATSSKPLVRATAPHVLPLAVLLRRIAKGFHQQAVRRVVEAKAGAAPSYRHGRGTFVVLHVPAVDVGGDRARGAAAAASSGRVGEWLPAVRVKVAVARCAEPSCAARTAPVMPCARRCTSTMIARMRRACRCRCCHCRWC